MSKVKKSTSIAIVFLFIFNLFFTNAIKVFAETSSILGGRGSEDPLKIIVNESGSIELYYWQLTPESNFTTYAYVNQYYANNAWGTNVFFTNNGENNSFSSDYYNGTFGQGVQSRNGNTITTIWSLGDGALSLKQQVSYTPGAGYYEKKWSLTNTSDSTYSDLKLIHGGDTYFGGDDSAMSYYSPETKMVYVRNSDMTKFGLMGFTGSSETPADRYFSGNYSTGNNQAISGNLSNTFNSTYQDAGYQLQWNKILLNPGDTWNIISNERLTPPGVLQSLAPAEKTARPGTSVTYEFIVQNFESGANDYKLEASSSNGWITSIQEGPIVNIAGNGGAKIIHVTVDIPADALDIASDVVTLKSEKLTNESIKSLTSTTTTIEVITGVVPEVNRILPSRTSLNVTVNTVHVDAGTPVTITLLDAARNPLVPAVVSTGVVGEYDTAVISLALLGNLNAGEIYTIQVAVQGVAGVNTSATISTDKVPSILALNSETGTNYVSNTKTNKDVILSSNDSDLEYSTNNSETWTGFVSPMSVATSGEYVFRFIGDTDSQKYTNLSLDINKVFQGNVSGLVDNDIYTEPVTPVITGDNVVTLSKDGGEGKNYTSGTEISEEGIYVLKAVDSYGNEVIYDFIVDKTTPTIDVTGNSTEWTKNNVVLDIINTVGSSGVSTLSVSKDGEIPVDITGEHNYTVYSNGSYTFTLTNGAGVSVSKIVEVSNIDKTVPQLQLSEILVGDEVYNYSPSIPAEENVVIKLGNSNDVLSGTIYYYSTDGVNWNEVTGDTFTISDTNNETVNYRFKSISNSGVESEISSLIPVYILKPSFTEDILINGNTTNGDWSNKDIEIILEGGINAESFLKYQYSTNPQDESSWIDMDGENHNTLVVSSDSDNTYYFRVISKGLSTGFTTEGTEIKVDKTGATDLSINFENNSFKEFINNITFGLFFNESVSVDVTATDGLSGVDYYEYQLVDIHNGETYDENGSWNKLTSLSVNPEFKGAIYARAVDKAGNISSVISTNGFIVENVQPTAIELNAKVGDDSYNENWVDEDIVVTLGGADSLAGTNRYEYRIGGTGEWTTLPETTGAKDAVTDKELKNKITINNNVNETYYFRAVSNSGLYSNESSILVRHDDESPTLKTETNIVDGWTSEPVTFTVNNENSGTISPVTYFIKIGSGDWTPVQGNTYTFNSDIDTTAQFKVVNASGLENVLETVYNIKIDKTIPVIKGVKSESSYYVGRVINYEDSFGEISSATYKKDNGSEVNLANGGLISEAGEYSIKVVDKSGNESVVYFKVKALPVIVDVKYTEDFEKFISSIREEFSSHDDLPEPYKTNTDNAIKALENRYADLDKEVKEIIKDKNEIKATVDTLSGKTDGLIAMKSKIQEEYNKTISNSLTAEQKEVLEAERDYLKGLLDTITTLEKKVSDVKVLVINIPKYSDGLMSQKDKVLEILKNISTLTKEQVNLLKDQVTELNEILDKIKTLENQVNTSKTSVNSIPKSQDGLISQKDKIKQRISEINELTKEQQNLLKNELSILNSLLRSVSDLEEQVLNSKNLVNSISKSDDGLIAQKNRANGALNIINGLTKEQQGLLNVEINILKEILGRIEILEDEVKDVNDTIDELPAVKDVQKSDSESVKTAYELYSNLNNEQKDLINDNLVQKLDDLRNELSKLMLQDSPNGITITGVDGTEFDPDAYLVVNPIDDESNSSKIASAKDIVNKATKNDEALKGKELLTLYDISIFKNNVKIQPNGKVQVKIEIPEELRSREELDIVYISDDGSVVSMNAKSDGEYLTFITDHFSMYGIVAKENDPKGFNYYWLLIAGGVVVLLFLVKRRSKDDEDK